MFTNEVVRGVETILKENGFTEVEPYVEFGNNISQPLQSWKYTIYMRPLGDEVQLKAYRTDRYNDHDGGYIKHLNPETEDWSWLLKEETVTVKETIRLL